LKTSAAHLLVFHGSRDPRPAMAVARLAALVQEKISQPAERLVSKSEFSPSLAVLEADNRVLVGTASLELAETPLHQQIEAFARQAQEQGFNQLQIIPLFLLSGVHVKEDIPAEVAKTRSPIKLELKPHLGSYQGIKSLLSRQLANFTSQERILLAHGSRRPGGNREVENLAAFFGAFPAYWSIQPSLTQQVASLIAQGSRSIAILPYFLFAGGITDAIEAQALEAKQKYPDVNLSLGVSLGATRELAEIIVEEGCQ
jgi:sirohydrochlorin cobaltochelatase